MQPIPRRLALVAIGGAVLPMPAVASPDPIYAAIERHRNAAAQELATIRVVIDLEDELDVTWHWRVGDYEPPSDCADPPEWIAAQTNNYRASLAEAQARYALSRVAPTTMQGLVALILYMDEMRRTDAAALTVEMWTGFDEGDEAVFEVCINRMIDTLAPVVRDLARAVA